MCDPNRGGQKGVNMNTNMSKEGTHVRPTKTELVQILTQVNDQCGEALEKLAKGPDERTEPLSQDFHNNIEGRRY